MKKSNLISLGLAVVIFLAAAVWGTTTIGRVRTTHEYLITKYYKFENITEEGLLQYFTPTYNHLDGIELFIANVYPETEGKISLTISNQKGKEIFSRKYRASGIPTGEFHNYKIGKKLVPGETYELLLSYDGKAEEPPQIMVSERMKNVKDTEEMMLDGTVSDYNMAITYHYSWKSWFGYRL